jgi:hypothetical protein
MRHNLTFPQRHTGNNHIPNRPRHIPNWIPLVTLCLTLAWIGLSAAPASAAGSCGSVRTKDQVSYRLKITAGSPGCESVRRVAKRYGHPDSVHYNCANHSHGCMYGVYPRGWRCTGLFQGTFGCWLGGNDRGENAEAAFSGALVYTRPPKG